MLTGVATFRSIGLLSSPWLSCVSHQHDTWEFVCYVEGTGAITVGDEPVPFAPGTIVCLPPRIPHYERSSVGYRNYHLSFADFVPPVSGVPRFSDDQHGSFTALCATLHRESRLGQARAAAICQHLGQALVELLERWAHPQAGGGLVDRVKAVLYARHRDPDFTIAAALAAVPCAPDHARRLFRAATGRTPLDWLTDLRLGEAKQLLASGSAVGEAAVQAGFADPFYFSRIFQRRVGASPSRWAARFRKH
ncbi:MAG TPA: AraC family transcriptional regulator [Planctomycetota bacterium]|nr:AraC family transcriptional regulator [Planctomycetota bacterium]